MSLVLEALRRVERSDARPGSVGVAVASYRPATRPRGAALPLLLGLATGVVVIFLLRPQGRTATPSPGAPSRETSPPRVIPSVPSAMPEPLAARSGLRSVAAEPSAGTDLTRAEGTKAPLSAAPANRAAASSRPAKPSAASGPIARPPLILQAISERDSRPVAVINDQLVREGDLFEGARVLRIGAESVDVLLENGKTATVRFAPPPPSGLSPIPESR